MNKRDENDLVNTVYFWYDHTFRSTAMRREKRMRTNSPRLRKETRTARLGG